MDFSDDDSSAKEASMDVVDSDEEDAAKKKRKAKAKKKAAKKTEKKAALSKIREKLKRKELLSTDTPSSGESLNGADDDGSEEDETTASGNNQITLDKLTRLVSLTQNKEKYLAFLPPDSLTMNEADTTEIQEMCDAIPGITSIENLFRFAYEMREHSIEEPLEVSIKHVKEDSNILSLTGIIFAGTDVLVAFAISLEHPISLLLAYQVKEPKPASTVYFYCDYDLYVNRESIPIQKGTLVPIVTHLVSLSGMCFINEMDFKQVGQMVRRKNVDIEYKRPKAEDF